MIKIKIITRTKTYEEMVELLTHISEMVEEGFVCGYNPDWRLEGEEEEEED